MFISSPQIEVFSFFSCLIVNLCISNVTQSIVLQFVENLKKHIRFFCRFSSENVSHMEWPSKHSCNYKVHVTVIIYFLALYS